MENFKICAVIPAQHGGSDIHRNPLSPFGEEGIPLLTWKIRQLKNVLGPDKIIVSSSFDDILNVATLEGVNCHKRQTSLENEEIGEFGAVVSNVVKDIHAEHIAWVSPVIPYMGEYDYRNAISKYIDNVVKGKYDSLFSVNRLNDYFWFENSPANYTCSKKQERRSTVEVMYKVTNGIFIMPKNAILETNYYIGSRPFKFEVSKLAGLDVNIKNDYDEAGELGALYNRRKEREKRFVFLDFDGVIFDSVVEAYAMAMLTSKKIKSLNDLNIKSEHAKRFFKQRYLVGPAWNYFYLLKSIDLNLDEGFDEFLPESPGEEAKIFQSSFFATRQVIRSHFWEDWLELNKLYDGADKFIQFINENDNVAIVTTKDKDTVKALLDNKGLSRNVDIYDTKSYEKFGCKSYFIDDFMRKNAVEKGLFIDDSSRHLNKCKWVENLHLMQACWGYVSPGSYYDNKSDIIKFMIKEFS